MDKLKPCPFCGGDILTFAQSNEYDDKISCCGCDAFMPRFRNKDKTAIIAAWNRRPPAHKYTLEELRNLENQPIWVIEGNGKSWTYGLWLICNGFEWRQEHTTDWITFGNFGSLECDDYNKTWVAYDRKPEEEI